MVLWHFRCIFLADGADSADLYRWRRGVYEFTSGQEDEWTSPPWSITASFPNLTAQVHKIGTNYNHAVRLMHLYTAEKSVKALMLELIRITKEPTTLEKGSEFDN